ncbi:MAG TPA: endonuclease/exonuclease/phosphatase family protein [Casimicrobium sp.]|nr:endonuclease/exonuclease/phosphatase family protein [Casimicrobium sp.]
MPSTKSSGQSLRLKVATYNIHKGFSHFNRRIVVHDMRERLRLIGADVVFLQEVVGHNSQHVENYGEWPDAPQHEYLAQQQWPVSAYAKNAVYEHGHHGNAILSRYPMIRFDHEDISTNRVEQRGLLHAEIDVPGWKQTLHCVCVHLGLLGRSRAKQVEAVRTRIQSLVPADAPLVIAGDFNDWRRRAGDPLAALGAREVFETMGGRPARSFPARLPILRLDRIYVRGFTVESVDVHRGREWARLSDHAPLAAELVLR